MYYVPQPTETARLIQTMLSKEYNNESQPETIATSKQNREENTQNSIGPEEVGYDIRNTVRDVLR